MTDSPLLRALERLGAGQDLTADETRDALGTIIDGEATETTIAALLTALRVKGETTEELAGAVQAVRDRMTPLGGALPATLDTCGTGGDGACTLNVSTGAAIVVAACGVPVAKHGNRSASGNSGSAEVLAELGIAIEAEPAVLRRCLSELGIAFLFAPRFHPALQFAAAVRRQLPFRTLFNLTGPLVNPARPTFQLVGVPTARQATLVARVLAESECRRAAVVTGWDGLDEVTLDGRTHVLWVERGRAEPCVWEPSDFGLRPSESTALRVSGPPESADRLRRVFAGEHGPARDIILANAAAALHIAGEAGALREAVQRAATAIDGGAAARLVDRWAALSHASA